MIHAQFEKIITELTYNDELPLIFVDKFWKVIQMIKDWKDHMKENVVPLWVNFLDESMSIWSNKWTCSGWVFCPRKPRPFVN